MTSRTFPFIFVAKRKMEKSNNLKEVGLLVEACRCWERMAAFRQMRSRNMRYCYGDQWGDYVMVDGKKVREEDYIRSQGSEPLKNNLIRRLVKQVLGLYRAEDMPLQCMVMQAQHQQFAKVMTDVIAYNQWLNRATELNSRMLEEFLISGMAVQRKTYGLRNGICDCWTDIVSPAAFFLDSMATDCRGWDVEMLGEIHDMHFDTLAAAFATSQQQWQELADIYSPITYDERLGEFFSEYGLPRTGKQEFFHTAESRLCRVIEIWYRCRTPQYLCHDRETATLYRVDATGKTPYDDALFTIADEWRYAYLTPFGDVLAEGTSPYLHGSHPYVFKAYPFVDAGIHSFVADIIDQQRYTNRLITLYDWVMRSSAKGVLLVPEESSPEGYSIEDIADEWARFNGVIAVKTRNGALLPQQVSANAVNVGINELLQTQLSFMEDISGVTGALQGKATAASVSGTLFQQQTHNAMLSQLDLLDTFRDFILDGVCKDMSNILQYYDSPRTFASRHSNMSVTYNPEIMRHIQFTIDYKKEGGQPE